MPDSRELWTIRQAQPETPNERAARRSKDSAARESEELSREERLDARRASDTSPERLNMCGITGYLNLNGQSIDPEESLLSKMCRTIVHRGPDDEGMLTMGPAAIGMTRLSIIDVKTGHQPIGTEDGSAWI